MKLTTTCLLGLSLMTSQNVLGQGSPAELIAGFDDLVGIKTRLDEIGLIRHPPTEPYQGIFWAGTTVIDTTNVLGPVTAPSYANTIGFRANNSFLMEGDTRGPSKGRYNLKRGYFGCYKDSVSPSAEPVDCTLLVDGDQNSHFQFGFKATGADGQPDYNLTAFDPVGAPNWMANASIVAFKVTAVDPSVDPSKVGVLLDSIVYSWSLRTL